MGDIDWQASWMWRWSSVKNKITSIENKITPIWNISNWCTTIVLSDEAACEALTDMPPRGEDELDAVTLHNQALMNMDANPSKGFDRLQFLLQQDPSPPTTFGNLLLLYIKYEVCVLYMLL